MQYAWYEIVGYGLLTAFLIWLMFQGLEWGLDRLLQHRVRRDLDEMNRTAPVLTEDEIQRIIRPRTGDHDGA